MFDMSFRLAAKLLEGFPPAEGLEPLLESLGSPRAGFLDAVVQLAAGEDELVPAFLLEVIALGGLEAKSQLFEGLGFINIFNFCPPVLV